MDNRFAKKYIVYILALFVGAFVVSACIVFGLQLGGVASHNYGVGGSLLICAGCALLPACSFNGFCTILRRINVLDKKQSVRFVLLVLPITLVSIPVGAVMLLPMLVTAVVTIAKK